MKRLVLYYALFLSLAARAQQCDCPPGPGDAPQTLTAFTVGGVPLGVCGYTSNEEGEVTYTHFSLYRCGDSKAIESWDKNTTCKVEQTKDGLLIKEMYNLPVGQSFSTLWRPFYIHKFTVVNGKVVETEYIDKQLPRYTKPQIADVISQYNTLQAPANEETMKVANMLFWASVSGSKEADALFNSMSTKFGPFENVIGEEWAQINLVYDRWKKHSK